ncbi:MAG: hypothetical protein JW955_01965 [Sedimentisphaerales bacterium]|nr:hypothetical protein [Sedimentisphaerales bacterium]
MINAVMLAIMVGCAVFLFLKGTLVQGITMIFNAIIAGFIAFGFFEMLAPLLAKQAQNIAVWAPLICFVLLLVVAFALLQTGVMQLTKSKADLGKLPEQIGRIVCGLVLGYLVTGYALVAVAMAPLPNQYPYPRFDQRNPDPSKPKKPVLSPDGFVTGLFATVSKGSFSAIRDPRSFAVLHAGYVDQLYLNRRKATEKVSLMTSMPTINVPRKGVRPAPDSLRDAEGKSISIRPGEDLILVRAELAARGLRDAGKFTLSQFRLVCGPRSTGKGALVGQGHAVYPLGYIGDKLRLERKSLDDIVTAQSESGEPVSMDLAFAVPSTLTPLVLEFKRNDVVQIPATGPGEEPLAIAPFGAAPAPAQAAPEPQTPGSPPAPGRPPSPSNGRGEKGGRDRTRERIEGLSGTSLEEN